MIGFNRLLPPGGSVGTAEYVDGLSLRQQARADRPYLVLNMIVSLDGRAAVDGRTAALQNTADHELFHALRGAGDAVLVGASTIRAEGYGETDRLVVIASNSLDLPTDRGVLRHASNRVLILTESHAEIDACAADVGYLRGDLHEGLRTLRHEYGVEAVVCEGGPHLNGMLFAAGLVDEIFVTIGSRIVAGDAPLTMVHGPQLDPPVDLGLVALLEHDGFLFARYRTHG